LYIDSLTRSIIYDENGIEARALIALRRHRFIPWQTIQHVILKFDKIIVYTSTSCVVIHGLYRGIEEFKERLMQECPHMQVEEE
jgi:hypothetical protein